ncbi:MAG: VOC family protein, partial [Methanoregula sp.]
LLPPHHPSPPPRFRYCRSVSLPLNTATALPLLMPNLSHFMIPADDVDRARRFYSALLGWTIEPVVPTPDPGGMAAMQYHAITTGPAAAGTLNTGGMYKRHLQEPILDFVQVEDIDAVVLKVEKLGGKITLPITVIPGVGLTAMILDTEGNLFGLLMPEKK